MSDNVSYSLEKKLQDKFQTLRQSETERPVASDEGPPNIPAVNERLAKLEGAFDWIKVTVALIATILIGGIAFLGVQITRVDSRISGLSEQVSALPRQVSSDIRDLTNTLAQTIVAARTTPPQVIMMPQPQGGAPATVPLPLNQPER